MKYTEGFPLGLQWAGFVELRDAYDWEPEDLVDGLPATAIEGVEAAVWTETLTTTDDLFTMLLPRLSAVAEVAWSAPGRKDWDDYRRRVAQEAAAWRRDGLAFHLTPQVAW
ncbi:family 20 glycosylhydrolase [Cellulosimicrobium sp. CUA-896]|uniref:family 20 glycosylhydrolase n=1 Tax=Cellulosimicrobium sp. CUA-896 TaxID=1517881 RepID=UPI002101924A|nr:family 20 glycosylhydrolase [Cellulosimicrobium sp. CUA-896]